MRGQTSVWFDGLDNGSAPQDFTDQRFAQFHRHHFASADGTLLCHPRTNNVAVATAPTVVLKVLVHDELLDHMGVDGGKGIGETQDCPTSPAGPIEELLDIQPVLFAIVLFQSLASHLQDALRRVAHVERDLVDNVLPHLRGEAMAELRHHLVLAAQDHRRLGSFCEVCSKILCYLSGVGLDGTGFQLAPVVHPSPAILPLQLGRSASKICL
jgi:hypothetical protein